MVFSIRTFIFFALIFNFSHAIIGGIEVGKNDWLSKSVVALQMGEKQSNGDIHFYKGTGVLISDRIILTAGHNFVYLKDLSLSSVIFSTRPNWGAFPYGEQRIPIKKVLVLPQFSQGPLGTQNDLALVLLASSIPAEYKPMKLDLEEHQLKNLIIAGYGRSSSLSSASLSDYRLRSMVLPFARWDASQVINSSKFWLDNQWGSIAGGDSGGPAIRFLQGKYVVTGIAIHERYDNCVAIKTCKPESAFTNLAFYKKWIEQAIQELKYSQ